MRGADRNGYTACNNIQGRRGLRNVYVVKIEGRIFDRVVGELQYQNK